MARLLHNRRFFDRALTSRHDLIFHPLVLTCSPRSSTSIFKNIRYVNGFSGPSPGQPGTQGEEAEEPKGGEKNSSTPSWRSSTMFKMFESAATTFASILVLA